MQYEAYEMDRGNGLHKRFFWFGTEGDGRVGRVRIHRYERESKLADRCLQW